MNFLNFGAALLLIASANAATASTSDAKAPAGNGAPADATAMLPDRLLRCVVGRATNIEPAKYQTTDDIIYEGRHDFAFRLPPIPKPVGPPPDPVDDPLPVDPRTSIVADPSNLRAGVPNSFYRVVDRWPERVEMISVYDPPLGHLMIVSDIDETKGTAMLFMTRIRDAASMDLANIYQGPCKIEKP